MQLLLAPILALAAASAHIESHRANGLDDYLRCSKVLHADPKFRDFMLAIHELRYSKTQRYVPTWAVGKDPRELRKQVTERFGGELELIRKGNAKPFFDPKDRSPFFSPWLDFRRVNQFAALVAEQRLAEGKPARAAQLLTDQMTFTHRYRGLESIADISGATAERSLYPVIALHTAEFSSSDWGLLIRTARRLLSYPTPLATRIPKERETKNLYYNAIAQDARKPGFTLFHPTDFDGKGDPWAKERDQFEQLPIKERLRAIAAARRKTSENLSRAEAILKRPERFWIVKSQPVRPNERLVAMLSADGGLDQRLFDQERVTRARLRLVIVHGLINKRRLQTGHLPATLKELQAGPYVTDPFTGRAMTYQVVPDGYRLTSPGTYRWKVIDLAQGPGKAYGGPE